MIHESDELNQKDLSDGLYLTKGAITKAVKKLEGNCWILRERSSGDRRRYILKLTKKGEDFIPKLYEINDEWEDKMGLKNLDSQFMETFNGLTLKSIDLNLKKE